MESKDIDDYPGGGIEVTEVPLDGPLVVTTTTMTVSVIAASPSPTVRRARRRRRPVDPRRSSAPVTSVMAAKRSASVGIQKLDRIANGANASPTMDARPTFDFVTSVIGSLTGQAYERLPLVHPVGTMQA
jgi:hypothetical protein